MLPNTSRLYLEISPVVNKYQFFFIKLTLEKSLQLNKLQVMLTSRQINKFFILSMTHIILALLLMVFGE